MAALTKRKESRNSVNKKLSLKSQKKLLEQAKELNPDERLDQKDVVKQTLLQSLLGCVTTKSEVYKSFARLTFCNSNTYCGWLGPNGFRSFGTYTFNDGKSYKGSFEDSLTRGMGKYEFKNGNTYEGEFLAGRCHGYGQYKTKGFRYDGDFKNGKFHGKGVFKSKLEEEQGTYAGGNILQGEVRDLSGVFKGDFDELTQRRRGTFIFKNGDRYEGNWLNDLFWGFGVYNWAAEPSSCTKVETKYTGYWFNGMRYALGLLKFKHRSIICQWKKDKKSGAGLIIAGNGNYFASAEMFKENLYQGSHCIKQCDESQQLIEEIFSMINPSITYETMDGKSCAFAQKIKQLVEAHSEWYSHIYPIRIPDYEVANLPEGPSGTELRFVQQVLSENYKDFQNLYQKYIHPADECLNNLSLNLFYMDVLQKVIDVSIFTCMADNNRTIHRLNYDNELGNCRLAPVSFYEFFQHFLRMTELLMRNKELNLAVSRFRPTFFGHLAIQVLVLLRILQTQDEPQFLVREAILVNRPSILELLREVEELSPHDKTLRTAYKYLKKKNLINQSSLNFIGAIEKCFEHLLLEGMLRETNAPISDLELVEVVLKACELKMSHDAIQQKKELKRQMTNALLKAVLTAL